MRLQQAGDCYRNMRSAWCAYKSSCSLLQNTEESVSSFCTLNIRWSQETQEKTGETYANVSCEHPLKSRNTRGKQEQHMPMWTVNILMLEWQTSQPYEQPSHKYTAHPGRPVIMIMMMKMMLTIMWIIVMMMVMMTVLHECCNRGIQAVS